MMSEKSNGSADSEKPLLSLESGQDDWEGPVGICHPKSRWFRYLVLVLICTLTFGSYFVYDIPGAIPNSMDKVVDHSFGYLKGCTTDDCNAERKSRVGLFYTVYSLPNTVICFFGGMMVDKLGIRTATLLFGSLVFAGQCIFSLGGTTQSYWTMLLGRFVFGLGGESLSVAQSTYTARWYRGHEMAFAFGIQLSVSRIGSSVNYSIEPWLSGWAQGGLSAALWFGSVLCALSVGAALVLNLADKYGERKKAILQEKADDEEEAFRIRDVFSFPASLWLIFFICVTFYIGVFVFLSIFASQLFQDRWGLDEPTAGMYVAIPYTVSAIASPFLGYAVDYFGKSLYFMLVACVTLSSTHLMLYFVPAADWSPLISMVMMGCAYSVCAAAIWPCVALITPARSLGSAYGLMTAIQNGGLAIAPAILPYVKSVGGTEWVQITFAILAGVAFMQTLLLIVMDSFNGAPLNSWGKIADKSRAAKAVAMAEAADRRTSPGPEGDLGVSSAPVEVMAASSRGSMQVRMQYYQRLGLQHAG